MASRRTRLRLDRSSSSSAPVLEQKFVVSTQQRDFHRQYYHLYSKRLEQLRSRVESEARTRFGQELTVLRLHELHRMAEDSDPVLVVGTLFKEQSLKPSILKELSDDLGVPPLPPSTASFVSADDELILEDSLQRIKVQGAVVDKHKLVTGVVCGLVGRERESGKFEAEQIVFPEMLKPQSDVQFLSPSTQCPFSYVAFMSGWELSSPNAASTALPLQMAVEWLVGEAGGIEPDVATIRRLIVAGNIVNNNEDDQNSNHLVSSNTKKSKVVDAMQMADSFLEQLASAMRVDVMPGKMDPANWLMPQQPMNLCLFPNASRYTDTFRSVSNPYCTLSGLADGPTLLGSSGQNVDDFLRNTDLEDPLDVMESLLNVSHIAPTCPDTLGCYPYRDEDPFVIDRLPHVFFAGNQKQFAKRVVKRENGEEVLLLSLPRFSASHSLVLLNERTLEAREFTFNTFKKNRKS